MATKDLIRTYKEQRKKTISLCKPLLLEDYVVQGMADVSPIKWHLAHTTWFYEMFILIPGYKGYKPFNSEFCKRFNSYYQQISTPYSRPQRGVLSRPSVKAISSYRKYIDKQILKFLNSLDAKAFDFWKALIKLGLNHEQQHQELMLMDIKYNYSLDPEFPVYRQENDNIPHRISFPLNFITFEGGLVEIGAKNHDFYYDNESPCHQEILKSYKIANRLITNAEYLEFMEEGGYQHPEYWLADGWDFIKQNQIQAPLYWRNLNNEWYQYHLTGLKPLCLVEPVSHINFYEADAFARWRGCRLPTEAEWEHAVVESQALIKGNFLEKNYLYPREQSSLDHHQFYGDLWEWTSSSYQPYPGFQPLKGSLGEYNGKFMSNQRVLRGGSCITPQSHIRSTYRNFYAPEKRWQFSGIRLATD